MNGTERLSPPADDFATCKLAADQPDLCLYRSTMKSAYELAMSRLEKSAPTHPLSDIQKAALAEVDSEYAARIAERKIFLGGEIEKLAGDPAAAELHRQLASDIAVLEEKREAKKERIRSEQA